VIAHYPEVRKALAELAARRQKESQEEAVAPLATPQLLFEEEPEILV